MSIHVDVNEKSRASDGRPVIRIGVFIPSECQLLDAAGVDIFGSLSHEYLLSLDKILPKAVIESASSIEIRYVGAAKAGEKIGMTASLAILATNHYDDPEVAPGKLDIIYVPGPDPSIAFPEGAVDWLRRQGNTEGVDILSVCTGIFLCGAAGLLKGKAICGPRGMQDLIRQSGFEPKSMRGHELRWIQDGNLWSSGGVTNGNDLVAAYCRALPQRFPPALVELVCELLDVGDRPQAYQTGQYQRFTPNVANQKRECFLIP
ncbi:class I glutamine amidotransferase-like protein [Xylaria sp. CBS 124048]|nr:class I glutamine amidotransferase-like protein [Xylaria sp. CBS 124048]